MKSRNRRWGDAGIPRHGDTGIRGRGDKEFTRQDKEDGEARGHREAEKGGAVKRRRADKAIR